MSSRSRRMPAGSLAAAAAISLSACGTTIGEASELALHEPSGDGSDALATGALALVDGRVILESADGSVTVPVFPRGSAQWVNGELHYADETRSRWRRVSLADGWVSVDHLGIEVNVPNRLPGSCLLHCRSGQYCSPS